MIVNYMKMMWLEKLRKQGDIVIKKFSLMFCCLVVKVKYVSNVTLLMQEVSASIVSSNSNHFIMITLHNAVKKKEIVINIIKLDSILT